MSSIYDAALYYVNALNWCLVPIPEMTKGPITAGWNAVENTLRTPEQVAYWKSHPKANMGVLLGPSKIVTLDIDNVEETKIAFETFGIDYTKILDGAPRIKGRDGHDKVVFSSPQNIDLTAHKLSWENRNDAGRHTIFELRAGNVQDVLPPSIHPDTKQPYEWVVEPSQDIKPLPKELLTIWLEWDKFSVELQNACPWISKKVIKELIKKQKPKKTSVPNDDNIIKQFNDRVRVTAILEKNGYKKVSSNRYLSPFSTTGLAGVHVFPEDNRIFSHHGSDPFDTTYSHDAFDLFCFFNHNEDMKTALFAAAKELGIKTKAEKEIEHGKEVAAELLKPPVSKPIEEFKKEMDEAIERCLLPPFPELDDGFFKTYVDLGKRVSYSLEEFHFGALLSLASMAIGRKVVIKVGMTSIYTNVFAMVVGQTTISGKSVACNMVLDNFGSSIVYEEPIAKCYSTNILRGTISEAALIQGLNDVYNSFWFYDDSAGFFEDATTWNAHILGTMCSIYDGSVVERTLSKRSKNNEQFKWSCPFPYVSLLFNTTTKDIEQIASSRLFSSGFFPRMMWFYGQGGQPRKNQDTSPEDLQIIENIKQEIRNLRESLSSLQNDSIVFGVCDIIEDWKIHATENRLGKEDEGYRTAVSRGFIHAYKIAVILAMFDKSFQKQVIGSLSFPIVIKIPDKHANMAVKIVEQYLIPRMMHVYDLCNNIDAKNHQVIVLKAINHFGGVADRTKLLRQTRLGKKDLDSALSTLIESGDIKCHCTRLEGSDKPTTLIIKQ